MKIMTSLRLSLMGISLGFAVSAQAQIGYQVSLLNTATGEPRANESVSVNVKITDSKGNVICEEVKNETTNDFGVVSMSVGNSETFINVDWNNLPFFIEASVDSRMIGRSQLLSVPVAEHAKHTGALTLEKLCSKTWSTGGLSLTFMKNGSVRFYYNQETHYGSYSMDGNTIVVYEPRGEDPRAFVLVYFPQKNILVGNYSGLNRFW